MSGDFDGEYTARCECDWEYHRGAPCPTPAHDHGPGLRVSPALCMQCLFVCCAERDEADDARRASQD